MADTGLFLVRGILIVNVPDELHDEMALSLQSAIALRLRDSACAGVVLDISNVSMIDTFIGRVLLAIGQAAKLMGATTVVAGMQPAVAMTLVELGMSLDGMVTALTVDDAMDRIGEGLVPL
ncbi:MAG: STAS domain-containing protein [Polyangiaceae bacterium]